MAKLLYRLGLFSARRAKTVIAAWFVALLAAVGAFAGFGGQLTDQISMPDLETTEVADRISEEMEDISGGSANAVIRTEDGEAFTTEQQEQIAELLEDVEDHEIVTSVVDPFVTDDEIASNQSDLEEARDELRSGKEELDDGQAEVDSGREELEDAENELSSGIEELEAGQEELDAAIAQAEQAGMLEALEAEFDAQQAQIDNAQAELNAAEEEIEDGLAQLEEAQADIDSGREELQDGEEELERGEALLDLAEGMETISADGDVAITVVNFPQSVQELDMDAVGAVAETLTAASIDGVEILPSAELSFELPEVFSVAEVIGILVAAVVLLVMLGTFIGAGLPLVNALIGVGVGVAAAMSLSGVIDMMSVTPILGLMLGLAVGIDYALFILHRHRRQLKDGMDVVDSIALSNGTAGNAVVFAGATVIIALLALNITGIGFLGLMGTVGAFCVFIAAIMAVTMTPALLSLVGYRILSKKERRRAGRAKASGQNGTSKEEPKALGTRNTVLISIASIAAIIFLALPAGSLRLGLPDASQDPEDTASHQAYQQTADSFGEGMNSQLLVLGDLATADNSEGEATDQQIALAQELTQRDDVEAAVPTGINESNDVIALAVIPVEGPAAESTDNLVHELRADDILEGTEVSDIELSVAGAAAANIDISDVIADALPLYLGLVIGLSLLLMVMVFRSILLPLVATLGFVASFAATMGVVVAVFQWGWFGDVLGIANTGPVLSFLPIIVMGILFGLGMDYQLFTSTGMREAYAHGSAPRVAVRKGLLAGRAVVTAAALIMTSVFAGFIFSSDVMVTSIGLALAVGVLLDAFVIRLLLVPSLLHLLGPAAWWLPKWLDRILPDVDVEGSALEAEITKRSEGAGI